MRPICDLPLPETRRGMGDPNRWSDWTRTFTDPSTDPAALIQRYSDALDEEAVRAADVLDLIGVGERATILSRLGKDAKTLQRHIENRLRTPRERADLVRAIFALRGELEALATDTAAHQVADSVANVLQADIGRATDTALGGLSDVALERILSARLPQLEGC